MLCQNCGKNHANTHIKKMINGKVQELYLCSDCAQNLGYSHLMGNGFNIGDLIGGMFNLGEARTMPRSAEHRCPFCGASFSDFVNTGKAGCSKCYDTFYCRLLPSLQRIHGKTEHAGKSPRNLGAKQQKQAELESLKRQLDEAVAAQEFEKAATLRDQIKEREGRE